MVSLSEIKNINNIQELALHYDLIQKYAYQINPKNKILMDDIVQDMFIKLTITWKNSPTKLINGGYVAMALMSVYRDYQRLYSKKMNFDVEFGDIIDDSEDSLKDKLIQDGLYEHYEYIKETKMDWYERKVLHFYLLMPLTQLSKRTGISYKSLTYTITKIKEKIK